MADYLRALKFPIIGSISTYFLIAVTIRLFPALAVFEGVPGGFGFIAIVGLLLGAWAGYKIVEFGGNFVDVILVSVIIATVGGILQMVEVGVLASFPSPLNLSDELTTAVYNFENTQAGAVIAGGFALTK